MGLTILATIFVFSVIIFVHELGHFATAKWAGMQVDEFALGLVPKCTVYAAVIQNIPCGPSLSAGSTALPA